MGNVFFKLLNMSIAAGWLVLAVAALRLVFKKAPRWVFCVLWAMVALRLALPFSVQSPFSVVPSVNTVSVVTEPVSSDPVSVPDEYSAPQTAIPAEVSSPQGYVSPSEHSAPEEPVSRPAYTEPVTPPAIPGTVDPAQTDNAHQQIQRIVIKTGIPAIDNTISAAETERAYTGEEQTGDIGAVLFWIWASGAALMASYAAFSYLRLRLRLRCSIKGADGAYVCDTIDTPFILGLFRPRIYVPSGMNGRERSYVLAHEKAHLRRFDHLWKPLGYLMLAAYWFNPLMWLAYIFFCRDIEIACDEKVVKTLDTESKAGYSQTLLDLNRPRRMISACPLAFGEVGVKERIKKVLSYKKPTLWILIAALLLTTVLAVCLMTDPKESSSAAESGEDASLPDGGSEEESKDTGENSTEEQFVPGGDIEIPDFLSKPFKELSAHPVPGTLNIYTCDELGGARAIFQTDGTSKARIDECFVFDHEYTDPASDYTMRVYAGRRFMNNGDGTYRAKTAYAVVGDLSDSPQYFEEEPVVYGKLVIVDHTDANGSVAGRRVFAPGLDNDPEIKYFDQAYTREGSDYILVNYSYYYESAERRPNWFVFDKNGTAYSLPVPAQYRWNVNSISFDTSSDDPDDVIAKYVLDDDTVTTVKANLKDMRPFTDLSAYYCKAPESSKHVLVLDPVEGSDLFYTCDEYPGKNIINGINSQTSFVFVVDEELFSLTGPDGTKATVFSGTDVHYGSGDLIEVESYALVCG
ncbi:MAG: hypothetical protein J5530_04715, partial [Clostridia bacterium]|nr:hypothetical protein [Clostridia bacterium]